MMMIKRCAAHCMATIVLGLWLWAQPTASWANSDRGDPPDKPSRTEQAELVDTLVLTVDLSGDSRVHFSVEPGVQYLIRLENTVPGAGYVVTGLAITPATPPLDYEGLADSQSRAMDMESPKATCKDRLPLWIMQLQAKYAGLSSESQVREHRQSLVSERAAKMIQLSECGELAKPDRANLTRQLESLPDTFSLQLDRAFKVEKGAAVDIRISRISGASKQWTITLDARSAGFEVVTGRTYATYGFSRPVTHALAASGDSGYVILDGRRKGVGDLDGSIALLVTWYPQKPQWKSWSITPILGIGLGEDEDVSGLLGLLISFEKNVGVAAGVAIHSVPYLHDKYNRDSVRFTESLLSEDQFIDNRPRLDPFFALVIRLATVGKALGGGS